MKALLRQTPAGERIDLRSIIAPQPFPCVGEAPIDSWQAFGSGTMALTAAMQFARLRTEGSPRVLVPAYSCPDILAAAQFAGLIPEFVDLAPGQTAPAKASVIDGIRAGIRLVLIVDLFGIGHDLREIGSAARACGTQVIHDQAQCHAGPGAGTVSGDVNFVVVSRGRGKPATLLHGGATWARDAAAFKAFVESHYRVHSWSAAGTAIRAAAYNTALGAVVYGGIARLPFLRLGDTRLQALRDVVRLPSHWNRCAAAQLQDHVRHLDGRRRRTLALCEIVAGSRLAVPADVLAVAGLNGLNRLPVICRDPDQARRLCADGASVGVSGMYGKTLPEFIGVSAESAAESVPNGYSLSRALITLPTHSRMTGRPLTQLKALISDC